MRKQSVVLYGPQGCGKTRNGAAIAKALGLKAVVEFDEVSRDNVPAARGALYLTNKSKAQLRMLEQMGFKLMPYHEGATRAGVKTPYAHFAINDPTPEQPQ